MTRDYTSSPNPIRFQRSRCDRVIAGICGGIAERFGWEPLVVRLLALALFLFLAGPLVLIAYIVVWMITPRRSLATGSPANPDEEHFWRGVSDQPRATFSNLKYSFMDLEDRLQSLERNVTSDEWRLRRQFRDLERD